MTQPEFNFNRPDGSNGSQDEELVRVGTKIGPTVLAFCGLNEYFHAAQLRAYVVQETQVAPASPDRILRALRQKGLLDYEVLDRRASFYRVKRVGPAPGGQID